MIDSKNVYRYSIPFVLAFSFLICACSDTKEPTSTTQEALQTTLLGDTTLRPTADSGTVGEAEAYRYTATASGTLATLKVFIDSANKASTLKFGVYSNSGSNNPGTLLTKGSLSSPTKNAWNTVTLSPTVSIVSGTPYWIANLSPRGGGIPMFRAIGNTSEYGSRTTTQKNLTDVPTTWSTDVNNSFPGWSMSVYGLSTDVAGAGGSSGAGGSAGSGGTAGMAGSSSGAGGSAGSSAGMSGSSGSAGQGGQGGMSGSAGLGGNAGSSGSAGMAGSASGSSGMSGAGGSSAGAGGSSAGTSGSAGSGGIAGTGGSAGQGGQGGMSGSAGVGGSGGSGGTTIFFDDFTGTSLSNDWVTLDRPDEAPGAAYYASFNDTVSSGNLNILSKVDGSFPGYGYSSGTVMWRSMSFTYGTLTVRAKMPGGRGTWPAVWLLGANCQQYYPSTPDNIGDCQWPNPGSDEIDVVEPLFGDFTHVNQQIHRPEGNPGCSPQVSDASQNWHDYQFVWSAGSAQWLVDGVQTCLVTGSIVPSTPMFLIVDTAIGGCCSGPIDDATLPQTMQVDSVQVTFP